MLYLVAIMYSSAFVVGFLVIASMLGGCVDRSKSGETERRLSE